ncbi:MAG: hypothetical protein A3H57_03670 [Candidatus Taylorbacteria bacterium RIFCSPLOWO2_02_FULL_43_11]|uniref:RNA helicase n=1 Tax=Candidatus Taylorbacteria bacterium RIFCSPHIGHO2_02_FULL_43_32b TaxID=1802306 RepID=A0A1G2MLU9_9BACT|nr:MAG: hypothetical protein A2743_04610 [Candidatus Taylorbacteria bacterium RIFCSPHIGHO2_01_FULL_43_47]OHA24818.1 MAG: hypothetical protein A3C72_03235 [Candidatus Taylorbacteria bacterium RIFCSPHIGHO2_02_FULL_43_32b]OHA31859.1 MAG: hypothetical protein A3B08_01110 [Candidatus Taylorbacteria bacterium RIFCSPLOWO2_01_FULL_43_44]OHA35652.1 MAG: hypothetical protein A3H57_03670 [Candidatus Taylorbacteria bacterium RIFCSPLOWO2_02_FULL_43_11]
MYQRFNRNNAGRAHSYGATRAKGRFGFKNRKSPSRGQYIDPSKFINRAVITEEVAKFVPEHKFSDFNIVEELKKNIEKKGYVLPTPIQDKTIPHVLNGHDVVGIANTGTGKTAAFLIPLINKVRKGKNEQVLIIVPTRELALQIDEELKVFARGMGIFSVCCVGGASIVPQIKALRYKNSFIVGTPGRLKDLIERKCIRLSEFGTLVLDEADRMLDMGFVADMRFIVLGMPKDKHTLFFSATISSQVETLIKEFLREPIRIRVTTGETARGVEQDVIKVGTGAAKLQALNDLLHNKEFNKVLVFGRTKHGVENLFRTLTENGFRAESIHGNKSHRERQRALGKFKDNQIQILVATDVAARGLDIPDVSHVINFDLPATYDDYVHRIGRTGRGNKRGKALTFL